MAHSHGIPVLVDGAQAAPHLKVDVQDARRRFLCPSPATRCTARPASACSMASGAARSDAAVSGRRRHDPLGHVREDDLQRLPYKFEAGTPQYRGRHRPRRGARLRRRTRHRKHRRATSTICSNTRPPRSRASPGLKIIGTAQRKGRRDFVHPRRHSPARYRDDSRPGRHRDSHRPSLCAAGDAALRRRFHRARFVRAVQHASRKSTRWSAASKR